MIDARAASHNESVRKVKPPVGNTTGDTIVHCFASTIMLTDILHSAKSPSPFKAVLEWHQQQPVWKLKSKNVHATGIE